MSIEAKIDALIAALNANTAARTAGRGAEPVAAAKAAATAEKSAAAAPAAEPKRGPGRPPKAAAVPTIEQVVEAANRFVEANDKPATRALLSEHGSPNGSTAKLPEANRAAFIAAVEAALAEAPEEDGEAADDDAI